MCIRTNISITYLSCGICLCVWAYFDRGGKSEPHKGTVCRISMQQRLPPFGLVLVLAAGPLAGHCSGPCCIWPSFTFVKPQLECLDTELRPVMIKIITGGEEALWDGRYMY